MEIYNKLVTLLSTHNVRFQEYEHPSEGRTEAISLIRGNHIEQAAKAMVIKLQYPEKVNYALVVVTGDCKINFKAVAKHLGAKKASFSSPEVAEFLTGCQTGAVPPFVLKEDIQLVIDDRIRQVGKLFFNAGVLDKSVSIAVDDYLSLNGNIETAEVSIKLDCAI